MDIYDRLYEAIKTDATVVSVALLERDGPTYHHSIRVAGLSLELGKACALLAHDLQLLRIAAGFHDIGKMGIPDSVLKKRAPFNDHDWTIMKAHSAKGQRIVLAAGLDDGESIGLAVRHHHERYDGLGYPDGLAGDVIPILARILAVVDTYDAMATTRVYGPARTHRQILKVLQQEQGLQHDPYLIRKFVGLIRSSRFKTAD